MTPRGPVSFVIPVHNGALFLRQTLHAVLLEAGDCTSEVIVVDDRSSDCSAQIAREFEAQRLLRVIPGAGLGAAAAINAGVRAARFPIICQIDQDVLLRPHWLRGILVELEDPAVAAIQGFYETDPDSSLLARVMSLDLEHRYAAIDGSETGHVCTGNTAYRADALHRVGLFDEALGYGYDNDVSYRLREAGYRLRICRSARSRHQWREGLIGYAGQQYGFGYGRLDLVAKHPSRITGDSVSPAGMMAHPLALFLALTGLAILPWLDGGMWQAISIATATLIGALAFERLAAGVSMAWRSGDAAALLFAPVHLVRDLAWVSAIAVWLGRRIAGRRSRPQHSMSGRRGTTVLDSAQGTSASD